MNERGVAFKIIKITEESRALLGQLHALETRCFSSPWSYEAFSEALSNRSVDILAATAGAEDGGQLIGFCITMRVLDEAELLNVATDPGHRRHGIARALLEAASDMLTHAEANTIYLEVRESNSAAQALYGSLGFERLGIRRRYYSAPTEDAVLMRASLPLSAKTAEAENDI